MEPKTDPIAVAALRQVLTGGRPSDDDTLDTLLTEPEFTGPGPADNTQRAHRTYHRLTALGRHQGGSAVTLARDTGRLLRILEWAATGACQDF